MNELKPEDVMRALECCHQPVYSCEDCPYFGTTKGNVACSERLAKDALALLREKDAEIEKWQTAFEKEYVRVEHLTRRIETTRAEAIAEFAERLITYYNSLKSGLVAYHIEQIAKELREKL
jgi:hypothetical protein